MTNHVGRRLCARINGRLEPPRVRHSVGFPRGLFPGEPEPLDLPWPVLLLILEQAPGAVFLWRLSAALEEISDTWHPTVEEALEQANFEYEGVLGDWVEIGPEVQDAKRYALEHA